MQLNRQLPRLVPIKDYCTCCIKPVVSIKQEKEEATKISSSWQGMKTRREEGLMRRKVKVWSRFREGSWSDGPVTWGTFRLAPTHKAPLCVCSCPLTGFDRPVFRCSSGSNVFEMEIYRGILFRRRLRSCCLLRWYSRSPSVRHSSKPQRRYLPFGQTEANLCMNESADMQDACALKLDFVCAEAV